MKRIVLGVQYDGRPWLGWQSQPHGLTVQDKLEKALQKISAHPVRVACAGRTDAGVHALEQVLHFDTDANRSLSSWVRGVNAHLPESIAVRWSAEVANDPNAPGGHELEFHARYSARARTYHYVLYNHPVQSPVLSGRAGWIFRPLDIGEMQKAAEYLIGEHDFSSFRAITCQAKSPVKHMYNISMQRRHHLIIVTLHASAFLHHMVRNIIGSLIMVGLRKRDPVWIQEILLTRNRSIAAPTFMPDGLYLAKVDYDPKWNLPQENFSQNWV
ncbi:MAG: truA [Solimicrobium sp.]|nr:truA [Solimicrobium sp.]